MTSAGGYLGYAQALSVTQRNKYCYRFACPFPELREAFEAEAQEVKKPRLLLTAAVPVGPDNIKGGYDVPAVSS